MLNLIYNLFIFLSGILLFLLVLCTAARLMFGDNPQMSSTLLQLILGWLTVIELTNNELKWLSIIVEFYCYFYWLCKYIYNG